MTIGEINLIVDAYNIKSENDYKTKLALDYALARNISTFVSYSLNGKKLPSLNETYPDLFDTVTKEEVSQNKAEYWQIYKEQFTDFADRFNKRKKVKENNDDRGIESINNSVDQGFKERNR